MPLPPPRPTRTCLVTGASSGIGTEIARELARRGHGVTLVARRADRLRELADELAAAHGVRVEALPADLADAEARQALPEALERLGLNVDVLVNNAGFGTSGPVHRAERDRELALVRTDVEAVVDLCTLFTPGMASRRLGAVLNIASTMAFEPIPGQASYAAAKAFVRSYTHALRAELAPIGVTVTALCPGPVATEFMETAGISEDDVLDALPKFLWVPASDVARAGISGLDRDRAVVVPGLANRIGATLASLAPPSIVSQVVARSHPALRRP